MLQTSLYYLTQYRPVLVFTCTHCHSVALTKNEIMDAKVLLHIANGHQGLFFCQEHHIARLRQMNTINYGSS